VRRVASLVVALSKSWLRSREAVFFALLFPIILLVIFSTAFGGGSPEFTLAVQNRDVGPDGEPTNLSATFVEGLEDVDVLDVRPVAPDRNLTAWRESGDAGDASRVLVIPEGFADRVRNRSLRVRTAVIADTVDRVSGRLNDSQQAQVREGLGQARNTTAGTEPVAVTYLTAPGDESAATVGGIVESVVFRFNQRALGVDEPTVTMNESGFAGADRPAAAYYLPAFIAAVVLINGVMTVPAVVARFENAGTLKRLAATPLRKRDWILATVVHQSLLAVLLTVVMVVVAWLLFGVTAVPGPLAFALVVVGAVGFTGLGVALGSLIPDPDAATSLGGAIAFPTMFLSGVFWELDVMPAALQTVGRLVPLYHFHRGLHRLLILETTDGIGVPFAVMGGLAVVCVGLAVVVTDWRDL
jgi:ABC-2 type transport system permease protein